MKKLLLKPGFETVFALSIAAVLGLPPILLAQSPKDIEIKIENGDTVVNGKNIKDLPPTDRINALKDIKNINGQISWKSDSVKTDTLKHNFSFRLADSVGRRSVRVEFRRRDNLQGNPYAPTFRNNRKNTQVFTYVNTDNEGISTHISFRISEVSNEDLKRMPHVEGGKFEIDNLSIVPEFSTGSILLMFDLPSKKLADVKFINSDGKTLWNEKVENGKFSKTFGLGLNGVYFLQIKQGNYIAVKRIVKEE
jgi:hypothetical protein